MHPSPRFLLAAGLLAASTTAFAATAFAATASVSGPQSFIDGTPRTKNDAQLVPVQIVSVDGNPVRENPLQLYPGPHWLEVAGPSARPGQMAIQSSALRVDPCTYYYLAARKNPLQPGQWKVIVDGEDTMVACNPADEIKKAQAAARANPPKAPPASH
ncbi:MAG: hypothetical protein JSR34_12775 [Proteobacteria bacterium]|nr:hypothetical protein [Pseudomonadota bacterium]